MPDSLHNVISGLPPSQSADTKSYHLGFLVPLIAVLTALSYFLIYKICSKIFRCCRSSTNDYAIHYRRLRDTSDLEMYRAGSLTENSLQLPSSATDSGRF